MTANLQIKNTNYYNLALCVTIAGERGRLLGRESCILVSSVPDSRFTFCNMFENVPLFEHMHSKLAKSTNMIAKMFYTNFIMGCQ